MGNTYEYQAYTLIGMADKFQTFFNGTPQNVTFEYKDLDGNLKTKTVPNISLLKQQLNNYGITSDDLTAKLDTYGKLGENLVFGNGEPADSVFSFSENVVYVDRNTATIYTKNNGGDVVNNFNATDINALLTDYMEIGRDVAFNVGKPGLDIPDSVKLYIDTDENTIYVRDTNGSLNAVSSIKQTPLPDISGPDSILETNEAIFNIDNFNDTEALSYNIVASAGKVRRSLNKIYYTPDNKSSNQTVTIEVVATGANMIPSNQVTITLNIVNVPDEADQVLINNAYNSNTAANNGWVF